MFEIRMMLAVGVAVMAVLSLAVAVRPRVTRSLVKRHWANA